MAELENGDVLEQEDRAVSKTAGLKAREGSNPSIPTKLTVKQKT